jgi:hypothetical protein
MPGKNIIKPFVCPNGVLRRPELAAERLAPWAPMAKRYLRDSPVGD